MARFTYARIRSCDRSAFGPPSPATLMLQPTPLHASLHPSAGETLVSEEKHLISTMMKKLLFPTIAVVLAFSTGCGNKQNANNEPAPVPAATSTPGDAGQTSNAAQTANNAAPSSEPTLKQRASTQSGPITIPAGTVITVRTAQSLGSKTSQEGETF